jgi:hypothetical protein
METYPKHITRRVKLTEMLNWESLFIPSRLSTHRSMKSSAGVNSQGRRAEKVKLLLNNSDLKPQAVRPQRHCRDDDLEKQKHCTYNRVAPPSSEK